MIPVTNAWSEPIEGLSARLRVEFEDLDPGLRHAVYLELRNESLDPVAVTNQPKVHADLFDAAKKSVTTSDALTSGPIPSQQWAVIPRDAYIGFRVDTQTVGVPARQHGMALLAIGGKSWGLRAGKYTLAVGLVFAADKDGPPNQWVGKLELPPVEVAITTGMVARK